LFNHTRLTLARQRRGLTKARLAELTGLSTRSISAYESCDTEPTEATLKKLSTVLGFPTSFFERLEHLQCPDAGSASFRSLSKMTAAQRDMALASGALATALCDWIEARFKLPAPDVPDLRHHLPEAAAQATRDHWGLGERPIKNVVHLLEAHGVRVFSLDIAARQVDAFSLWRDGTPFAFLNTTKSAEHARFDAAHELGHLVMHRHASPEGREAETQANAFASAFLMTRGSVLAAAPRFTTIQTLVQLKRKWDVSVAALAHRLHDVGILSDWHYRQLCIELSQLGYRRTEPAGIPRETSQVLAKVFQALRADGVGKARIAEDLDIAEADLDAMVFGLTMVAVKGGRPERPRSPGATSLTLVAGWKADPET
jgi:Zn-dependent peptidase ImmA (M78 family)